MTPTYDINNTTFEANKLSHNSLSFDIDHAHRKVIAHACEQVIFALQKGRDDA